MFEKGKLLSDKDGLDQLFCAIFCLPAGVLLKVGRTGNPALFRQNLTGVKPSQDLSPGIVWALSPTSTKFQNQEVPDQSLDNALSAPWAELALGGTA